MKQAEMILKDLKKGKRITPISALRDYGCFRLSARVYDLKSAGHPIECKMVSDNDKTFAEYRMPR